MKILKLLILFVFVSSCSSVRVNFDYEPTTNFSHYKTYNYYSDMQMGMSELDAKRFLDILDAQLKQKGLELSATPDFFIDIKSSEYQNPQRSAVGVGVGGTGRNVGGGISIGLPVGQSNVNRQIIIDFVDENKSGLFWQAVTESSYNPNATPEKRETILIQVVTKALEGFPPKK